MKTLTNAPLCGPTRGPGAMFRDRLTPVSRLNGCNRGVPSNQLHASTSFDHTMVKAPDPIRTPKLSTIGPAQYCGGGPRGNRRCRMFLPFCSTAGFEPHNARWASGSISESNPIIKHTFSAFWLRSSVVSVLISLISDTMVIDHPVD